MTITSGNRSAVARWIDDLERDGPQPDPRTDVDTRSLQARFPHLATVDTSDLGFDSDGVRLPARLYVDRANPPRRALVWVHGGGYIHGSIDSPEANWTSLELATRGIAVCSIEYRKALGGVTYPAPLLDVGAGWDAACTLFDHTGIFDQSGSRDVHLGGASAGANLATCLAVDRAGAGGRSPRSVVLLYPLVHAQLPTLSPELRATLWNVPDELVFTADDVAAFSENFVGSPEFTPVAFAGGRNLRGLPPTFILNAELDSLRASGEALARQLTEAGVDVTSYLHRGVAHGHVDDPTSTGAADAFERIAAWVLTGHDRPPVLRS